jgi:pumilio family protein 6
MFSYNAFSIIIIKTIILKLRFLLIDLVFFLFFFVGMKKQEPQEFSDDEPEQFEFDSECEYFDDFDENQEKDTSTQQPESNETNAENDAEKKRLARLEQKKVQLERKLAKPNADLIFEAKQLWEKLRQKSLPKNQRIELMDKMMKIVSGKALDVFLINLDYL